MNAVSVGWRRISVEDGTLRGFLGYWHGVLPGEPVASPPQTAIAGSMCLAAKLGFTEVERFQAWDAEQWLGLRSPVTPSA